MLYSRLYIPRALNSPTALTRYPAVKTARNKSNQSATSQIKSHPISIRIATWTTLSCFGEITHCSDLGYNTMAKLQFVTVWCKVIQACLCWALDQGIRDCTIQLRKWLQGSHCEKFCNAEPAWCIICDGVMTLTLKQLNFIFSNSNRDSLSINFCFLCLHDLHGWQVEAVLAALATFWIPELSKHFTCFRFFSEYIANAYRFTHAAPTCTSTW